MRDRRSSSGGAARALARLQLRLAWRPPATWALVFFSIVAASALAYDAAFPDRAARRAFEAAITADRGVQGLVGPAHGIATMIGFVQWRSTVFLGTIGAVWAVLATARLLRGSEDDGHAELLGAQPLSRARQTGCALAAVLALCGLLALGAFAGAAVGGIAIGPALLFGVVLASPAVAFAGIGAVLAQLAPSRGRAAAWGGGLVALAFALRVAADSEHRLHALGVLSPIAWAQRATPLTGARPLWPVLALAVGGAGAGAAVALAAQRDVGAALWRARRTAGRAPRSIALVGAWGPLAGWVAGAAAFSFMTGTISASVRSLERAGGHAIGHGQATAAVFTPRGYLSTVLLMLSVIVAVQAAGAAVRARDEEASGRLEPVLAGRQRRAAWLSARVVRGAAGATLVLAVAGMAAWAGARSRGIHLGLGEMLGAGLGALPQVTVCLGLATLAFGRWPRATAAVAYGGAGVMFLVQTVGEALSAPSWVTWISPFAHAATAPLHPVAAGPAIAMLLIGAALACAGVAAFERRDVGAA